MKRRGQDAGLKMQISKHEHSNNDENFERAPLGSFEKADDEELRKRKIIRVKRSTSSGNQPSNFFKSSIQANDTSTTPKNPFAGINLAKTNASPFGGSTQSSTGFNFGSSKAEQGNSNSTGFVFGSTNQTTNDVSLNQPSTSIFGSAATTATGSESQTNVKNPFTGSSFSNITTSGFGSENSFDQSKDNDTKASTSQFVFGKSQTMVGNPFGSTETQIEEEKSEEKETKESNEMSIFGATDQSLSVFGTKAPNASSTLFGQPLTAQKETASGPIFGFGSSNSTIEEKEDSQSKANEINNEFKFGSTEKTESTSVFEEKTTNFEEKKTTFEEPKISLFGTPAETKPSINQSNELFKTAKATKTTALFGISEENQPKSLFGSEQSSNIENQTTSTSNEATSIPLKTAVNLFGANSSKQIEETSNVPLFGVEPTTKPIESISNPFQISEITKDQSIPLFSNTVNSQNTNFFENSKVGEEISSNLTSKPQRNLKDNEALLPYRASLNKSFLNFMKNLPLDSNISKWELGCVNYISIADNLETNSSSNETKSSFIASNSNLESDKVEKKQDDSEKVGIKVNDDEILVYQTRSRIMQLNETNKWEKKSIGTILLIKSEKSDNSVYVRVQNERTGRTTVNLLIPKGFKVNINKDKKVVLFSGFSFIETKEGNLKKENEGKTLNFLCKFKTNEQTTKFGNQLQQLL